MNMALDLKTHWALSCCVCHTSRSGTANGKVSEDEIALATDVFNHRFIDLVLIDEYANGKVIRSIIRQHRYCNACGPKCGRRPNDGIETLTIEER